VKLACNRAVVQPILLDVEPMLCELQHAGGREWPVC
jgi:hypothetical protein